MSNLMRQAAAKKKNGTEKYFDPKDWVWWRNTVLDDSQHFNAQAHCDWLCYC